MEDLLSTPEALGLDLQHCGEVEYRAKFWIGSKRGAGWQEEYSSQKEWVKLKSGRRQSGCDQWCGSSLWWKGQWGEPRRLSEGRTQLHSSESRRLERSVNSTKARETEQFWKTSSRCGCGSTWMRGNKGSGSVSQAFECTEGWPIRDPSLLYIAVINSITKSILGGKGFYHLTAYSPFLHERKLWQEPGGRHWNGGHGEALLTGWQAMACSACFHKPQEHYLGVSPPKVAWDLPHWSRKCPTDMSTGQFDEGNCSIEIPSSKICLGCVKLEKKITVHQGSNKV